MRLTWPKSRDSISKIKYFCWPKIDIHGCIQNVKDGIHIRVYRMNRDRVSILSSLFRNSFKRISGKSQAQFREKLRKLRLRNMNRHNGFIVKKNMHSLLIYKVSYSLAFLFLKFLSW